MAHQRLGGDTLTSSADSNSEAALGPSATFDAAHPNDAYAVPQTLPRSAPSGLSVKKRKHSKAKAGKSSSRSMSSPWPGMSDSDDKKPNKLGYQRISIACAHCRRRKIRCVIDENDPRQRCQNCIRLKKECLFFPVEQQNAMEEASQTSSKAGQSSTVSSSPPEIGSGRSFDETEGQHEFSSLTSNLRTSHHGMHLGPRSPVSNSGHPAEYDVAHHSENHSPWIGQGEFDSSAQGTRPPLMAYPNQHNWQFSQSPTTGDFAPFPFDPMHHPPHQQNAPAPTYVQQSVNPMWQQVGGPGPYGHVAKSIPNSDAAYASGYSLPSVGHDSPSIKTQTVSTVDHGGDPRYALAGHHQQHFPSSAHTYDDPMSAHSAYSNHWYSNQSPFQPQHEGGSGSPTEGAAQHRR